MRRALGSASAAEGHARRDRDKLNKINATLADPKMKVRLANLGGTVIAGSPADFGKLLTNETEKWAKVIKFANIKPD
jgi:hypothetical protein